MSKSQPPQPQPLPQSIILGCNAFNCASKISNANWETKLNEQVIVNQGDSIGVKASFIDTRGTASGNIVLTKDTEISLEYYFYWIHTFNACDGEVLNLPNATPDSSNNLTQQVLVGRSIPELYSLAKTNNIDASGGFPIPAYIVNDTETPRNYAYTPINDADSLPYIVYQSSNVIPVPAVFGPIIPACEIVAGTSYVIASAGVSTNWEYCGVPNASKNILPPNWPFNTQSFLAVENPNGITVPSANPFYDNPGMSPPDFLLPADVNPTLPYVSYMITDLGNTDWLAIDPNLESTDISSNQMVAGTEYAIDDPGNLNWTAFGAANNLTDTIFTYNPPPTAPPAFPITLNNAFFLTNAVSFVNPGKPAFGLSPGDTFECVIDINGSGDYILVSYSGSGQWCLDISSNALWNLPPATFGVNTTVCPTATNLVITGFSATVGGPVPVSYLVQGDQYTVYATGVLDSSNPPFTWNMVSNLPTTDTANMVAGNQYQVYEYNNVVIPYAPNQGVLTDVFTSQGPIAVPPPAPVASATYDLATPNLDSVVTFIIGTGPFGVVSAITDFSITISEDASGNCLATMNNNPFIITQPVPFGTTSGSFVINGAAGPGLYPFSLTIGCIITNGQEITYIAVSGTVPYPLTPAGIPSKLVELQGQVVSTDVYNYTLTTPNINSLAYYGFAVNTETFPVTDLTTFNVSISASPDGSGNFYFVPYPVSVQLSEGQSWFDEYTLQLNFLAPPNSSYPPFTAKFQIDQFDVINIYTMRLISSTPAQFPTVLGSIPFIASGPYTGVASSSTATPLFGTLSAATVSGTGFLAGTVYNTPPKVGTIFESLFPDPGSPPSPPSLIFSTEDTQNLYTVVKVFLDGVQYDFDNGSGVDIELSVTSDANGNCQMSGFIGNQAGQPSNPWLDGVTTATTVIDDSINGGTLPVLTFTSTAANFDYPDGEITGFTAVAPLVPYPYTPSTGKAAEYPSPYTFNNVVYDGTVRSFIAPTYKTDVRPVKKKWKMMLKAGSYDPNFLAESITRSMSKQKIKRVNNVKNGPLSTNGTQSTLNIPTDSVWDNDVSGNTWAIPANAGSNTFYDAKNLKVYDFPSEFDYNINPDNDDMPFLFVPAMNGSALHNDQQNNTDYIYAEIPHPNAQTLNFLPPPAYYINLVPLLSDVKSVSPTIPPDISGNDYYTILPFYSQNCTPAGNSAILPIAYGATQTSLLYNNEGDGRFSFNYLHSPILAFLSSNTNDLTECTAHMYTAQAVGTNLDSTLLFTSLIDKKSGILLKDMQPRSFWEQLGFDVPSLTVDLDDKPPGFQMTLNEFESKTTGAFCGSSNIFNANFKTYRSADQPSVPDTENLFLSVLIPSNQEPTIAAYAPGILNYSYSGLIPGSTYKIVNPGTWYDENNPPTNQNWQFCGGPANPSAGDIFVASLTTNPDWSFAGCGVWPGFPNYVPNQSDPNPSLPSYAGRGDWGNASCVLYNNKPNTTNTQLQNNYFEVQNTNTLNAGKIPTVRDQTGHFLIEIVGYNSIYLDDKNKREIKSIVSSYYVSQNSFVSQVFPESYNYYHVGAPISISNLKIRILDPFTMEEAQIGPNNSVYIQVNKMLSDLAVAQVEN